jgi:3-methyladenine DNA glycosylase/8-oxoguanine DNA glycosylase
MVYNSPDMNDAAPGHWSQADPILGEVIAKVGPCTLEPDYSRSPFQSLVQAVDDFGIRTGSGSVYGKRKLPEPKVILKHGERWKPHRSMASWYLWRAVDWASEAKEKNDGSTWP